MAGKFGSTLDEYVYQVSVENGCDDEAGDANEYGAWHGLMRDGKTIFRDHDPFWETLNDEDRSTLENAAGAIITEDSYGFVSVEFYDTAEALDAAWATIQNEE